METILLMMLVLSLVFLFVFSVLAWTFAYEDLIFRKITQVAGIVFGTAESILLIIFLISLGLKIKNCCGC